MIRNQLGIALNFLRKFKTPHRHNITAVTEKNEGCTQAHPLKYVDLGPVQNADPEGIYAEALTFALDNPDVKNIALTGPFGSGKSSIIKTFQTSSSEKYKFLNISLASFNKKSEGGTLSDIESRIIEQSILQQMLYGADANNLPFSRFKRISTPTYSLYKSIAFVFWLVLGIFLFNFRDTLSSQSTLIGWAITFSTVILFLFISSLIIEKLYSSSFKTSLKKFSLSNGEFETADIPESSILNRYIDEIIYFFQQTKYNVVVIEDLDRFKDTEIFVKLREINHLINANRGEKITFLYAVKDDMFSSIDRAKFFEFIIPVIPIVNSSNSLDKIIERAENNGILEKIDKNFIREVSIYLTDMRLINNIINEFHIYLSILEDSQINATKLLAIIVYKNVYPDDFEKLHHGEGIVFSLCAKRTELIIQRKSALAEKIPDLHNKISSIKNETTKTIKELILAYVGYIVCNAPYSISHIRVDEDLMSISSISDPESFDRLINSSTIRYPSYDPRYLNNTRQDDKKILTFSELEEKIHPGKTFYERKELIEGKVNGAEKNAELIIRKIQKDMSNLSNLRLSELVISRQLEIDILSKENSSQDFSLLTYLIRNDYIDETYHLYISRFHEGRMSRNDHAYIVTIRNFEQPDPQMVIDNPDEVCEMMREEDFSQIYALNINLVDYLFSSKAENRNRIDKVLIFISENYDKASTFLSAYYSAGKYISDFVFELSHLWHDYATVALENSEELLLILLHADQEIVVKSMNKGGIITRHLSYAGSELLRYQTDVTALFPLLKNLGVKFKSLSTLKDNPAIIYFSYNNNLYEINIDNIIFIIKELSNYTGSSDFHAETANYSAIIERNCQPLQDYVENNIEIYVRNVLKNLDSNVLENEISLVKLMKNTALSEDLVIEVLSRQQHIFGDISKIPERYWATIVSQRKLAAAWENVLLCLKSEFVSDELLTELFDDKFSTEISQNHIKNVIHNNEDSTLINDFILKNNGIPSSSYKILLPTVHRVYVNLPSDIEDERIAILINYHKVIFSQNSFNSLEQSPSLQALFVGRNFSEYAQKRADYPLTPAVKELLLESKINNEYKLLICLEVTLDDLKSAKSLPKLIARQLILTNQVALKMDKSVLARVIGSAASKDECINLLLKYMVKLDEASVMAVLSTMQTPFSEISEYGKRPKLPNNKLNMSLAQALKARGYISSYGEELLGIRINTKKYAN